MDVVLMNHLWILVNLEKVRVPQTTVVLNLRTIGLNCLWIPGTGLIIKIGSQKFHVLHVSKVKTDLESC